jgi:putative transcriptional regulator
MEKVTPGTLLISDPFLQDPHFTRSVVLICEDDDSGTLGFILNKKYDQTIDELVSDLEGFKFPLFYGGPVQVDTIHFIHKRPDLIEDGIQIQETIYWGGDFDKVVDLIRNKILKSRDIKFFIGYSGWEANQLNEELETKSWITRDGTEQLIFHPFYEHIWKDALKDLGGEYAQMVNYPLDPQHN